MPQPRRVAVIISSQTDYGRRLLTGISAYARKHADWRFFLALSDVDAPSRRLARWDPDGVIAQVGSAQAMRKLVELGKPVVNASSILDDQTLPHISADDAQVARIAADHFLERGFGHFAYYCHAETAYARRRCDHFCQAVRASGAECDCFGPPRDQAASQVDWETRETEIQQWLDRIPRPVAMLACNDLAAVEIVGVCQRSGIRIPDQVALMGVDNDQNLCEFCSPALSSIDINIPRIGHEAAAMLDQLIKQQPLDQPIRRLEPVGIVSRQSTDVLASKDAELVSALRYIRDHACEGIDVDDLLQTVEVSRRSLERRFRKSLGRSPREHIRRIRLEEARRLLARTDLPLAQIAHKCGFKYLSHLSLAFKKYTGMAPSAYRRQMRAAN